MPDRDDVQRRIEDASARTALRQVYNDIRNVKADTEMAARPKQSGLMSFISCDNLRISLDDLRDSASQLPLDSKAFQEAQDVSVQALAKAPASCRETIERYLPASSGKAPPPNKMS